MFFRTPIETVRLILRNESDQDFTRFYMMNTDPEVMKYIGDGSILKCEEGEMLKRYLNGIANHISRNYGPLAVYGKDNDLYLGWCGLLDSNFLEHIELGYRFCRDAWGYGYATEASRAVLTETYTVSDLDEILACTHPGNKQSIRVLDKLGFTFLDTKHHPVVGKEVLIYHINRSDFRMPGSEKGSGVLD